VLAIQIAVILAPIVCGTLGEKVAWHWGFGAAGVGMVIGLFVYLAGRRWLPPEEDLKAIRAGTATAAKQAALTGAEKARMALLLLLIPVLMLSIVGNQQYNNAFPLWSQKYMDLVLLGWQVPVTWLQAVDAFISTFTMIASIAFWRWWATRRQEPDDLMKMALGSILAAGGPALIVSRRQHDRGTAEKVSFGWTLGLHDRQRLRLRQHPAGRASRCTRAPRRRASRAWCSASTTCTCSSATPSWLARRSSRDDAGGALLGAACGLVAAAGVLLTRSAGSRSAALLANGGGAGTATA
jgi:hypothetical protein